MKLKSNNEFIKFLFRGMLFFSIIFITDRIIGYGLSKLYFSQTSGLYYRSTYAIEKSNAEILVFGSSRANHHYHPNVFEDSLKMTFYNAGRDGMNILYHYAVFKSIIKRHKPKIIILDINIMEFLKSNDSNDRISALLPYYEDHKEIREIIYLKSKYERIKVLSKVYLFNSNLVTMIVGNTRFNEKRKPDMNGYVPLNSKKLPDFKEEVERFNEFFECEYTIDKIKVKYYEKFIQVAKSNNIRIIIINSPYILSNEIKDLSIDIAKEIALKNNVPFYNYNNIKDLSDNIIYFSDFKHLNETGSKKFSCLIIDSIFKKVN